MSADRSGQKKWARPAAGAASAIVEMSLLMPLDVVKTRSQLGFPVQKNVLGNRLLGLAAQMAREEGFQSLYKGLVPLATQQAIKYATRHGMFQVARDAIWDPKKRGPSVPSWVNLQAGLAAGMVESLVVTTPFEVVKTAQQKERGYTGTLAAAAGIVRNEGIPALWKGVVPTMLRGGTNQACNFFAASAINRRVWGRREGDGKNIAVWKTMITGFTAGCIGPTLNNPLDVAKTRLMAQAAVSESSHSQVSKLRTAAQLRLSSVRAVSTSVVKPYYTGVVDCIFQVAAKEGIGALWSGIVPRLLRTGLGQAISWTVITRVMVHMETSSS